MLLTKDTEAAVIDRQPKEQKKTDCYHCGTPCITNAIAIDEKVFCCEGCKLVYEILNDNGLCDYYKLQTHPGLSQIKPVRSDKYAYLDNEAIASTLYSFTDGKNVIVTLYIPGVHCASCMWLLEHMNKLNPGITQSRMNFTAKEVTIHFRKDSINLRQVAELLTTIGYEPYISLDDAEKKKGSKYNKQLIYKLGVAGFCFGNIMMFAFPEYLAGGEDMEKQYANMFRYASLLLSLPVFFYSASEFYVSAWKGLKQKMLNIDAPIVLALVITYARSIYEILSGTGSGFLDSMSGIVFFMLAGRIVQERAYKSLSFHRDYKAYFPIAVNVMTESGVVSKSLKDLKEKDVVQLHNDEIVPADAMVIDGIASIDYSFVTGESEPVSIKKGEMVYAGGRQTGDRLMIQIIKPVAGSYLTSLWNHYAFSKNKTEYNKENSAVHIVSKYFTYILLSLAAGTAVYWYFHNPALILPSVSAMLIVACPCTLLLADTYTNGNLLRLFSNNGLFLRDATVIEQLGKADHIVFDKTGTLTQGSAQCVPSGHQLTEDEKDMVYAAVVASKHPYSKALAGYLGVRSTPVIQHREEIAGLGITARVGDRVVKVGSAKHVGVYTDEQQATVYVAVGDKISSFQILPYYRPAIEKMIPELQVEYRLSLLSGDNNKQQASMQQLFGSDSQLLFEQKPIDKLHYIEQLQKNGENVMMVGDGLNDAGALQQSNVGITLADDINNFTPSCDAILDASKFSRLPGMMSLARAGKKIVGFSFFVSILYNFVGLSISMQGKMSPMIAAILMPLSTLSVVLITTGSSSLVAAMKKLQIKGDK